MVLNHMGRLPKSSIQSSMASSPSNHSLFFFLFSFLFLTTAAASVAFPTSPELVLGSEKLTHLHFYFHEVFKGPNFTTINVVKQDYPTKFGNIDIIDAVLREGPSERSRMVGRVQGVSFHVSQEEEALLLQLVLVFTAGDFAGSSLTVVGRLDADGRADRAVVGGTGRFLFARGHVVSYVMWSSDEGLVAVYDIYLMHYDSPRHGSA